MIVKLQLHNCNFDENPIKTSNLHCNPHDFYERCVWHSSTYCSDKDVVHLRRHSVVIQHSWYVGEG